MEAETSTCLQAAKNGDSSNHPQRPAFFRVPPQIRQKIYAHSLVHAMHPSPENIYFAEEHTTRLPPASLYFVNRQIHFELRAIFTTLLKNQALVLNITPRGTFFSSQSETLFLAGRSRDINQASKLILSFSPPHPDRPVDIFDIWWHATKLRRQLIQVAPLQSLVLRFDDNEIASWCQNGRILDTFWPDDRPEAQERDTGWNDLTNLTDIFCSVRAARAGYQVTPKLGAVFQETSETLDLYTSIITGDILVPSRFHNEVTLADQKRWDKDLEILRTWMWNYNKAQELRLTSSMK